MDFEQQKKDKIKYFRAQAEQYNFTREYSKAMEFYIRAGLLGDLESIQNACDKLRSGYGMSYNFNEIFRCMKVGAEAGLVDAMAELAICFGSGLGTAVDQEKARFWMKKAAELSPKIQAQLESVPDPEWVPDEEDSD